MLDWELLEIGDIRKTVATIVKKYNKGIEFPDYNNFVIITKMKDCVQVKDFYHQCKHVYFMYIGKMAGFWELSWDIFPESNCDLYPIQLVVIDSEKTEHKWFFTLLADLQLFKSSNDAKRNGWNKAIEKGDFFFKKKTYILRII